MYVQISISGDLRKAQGDTEMGQANALLFNVSAATTANVIPSVSVVSAPSAF